MKRMLQKPFVWAVIFSLIAGGFSTYVLMDTFVIPTAYSAELPANFSVLATGAAITSSDSVIASTSPQPYTKNSSTATSLPKITGLDTVVQNNLEASSSNSTSSSNGNTSSTISSTNVSSNVAANNGSSSTLGNSAVSTSTTVSTTTIPTSTVTATPTKTKSPTKTSTPAKTSTPKATSTPEAKVTITSHSYHDSNIDISISEYRKYSSTVYIANVTISSLKYLKSAFAKGTYGRNYTATTSSTAEKNNAIFAVNGDFYGSRSKGYVLRNGNIYRSKAGTSQDLVISNTGDFSIISESKTSLSSLNTNSIWQIFSFGPSLVKSSAVSVSKSNDYAPRTAIGIIDSLHYVFIVADGRSNKSRGLSLYEMGSLLKSEGCSTAYNLDGGGSSTMYFNGTVINNPTDGWNSSERKVSDIVYIG